MQQSSRKVKETAPRRQRVDLRGRETFPRETKAESSRGRRARAMTAAGTALALARPPVYPSAKSNM
jgi:hypothetical protein